jgi:transcription elongation factor Elf1
MDEMQKTKTCPYCNIEKPLVSFYGTFWNGASAKDETRATNHCSTCDEKMLKTS